MPYHYNEKGEKVEWTLPPDWRPDIIHYARPSVSKPIQKYILTVKYPPSPTANGGAYVKDEDGVKNFGDATLLNLEQNDVIDVERTHNPPKGKYNASFNIVKWTPHTSGPAQLALVEKPKQPFTRPRTDPVDQKQIYMSVMLKGWNAAYAQFLSITPGDMKKVDAAFVQQAMQAYSTAYDQFYGSMTQSNKPPVEDDMDDAIPDF